MAQAPLHGAQLPDGLAEFLRLGGEHPSVNSRPAVRRKHARDLVERKTGGTPERDQRQPLQDAMIEEAVQAPPADGLDQALFLVETKRRRRNAGALRDLGNVQVAHPLDLKWTSSGTLQPSRAECKRSEATMDVLVGTLLVGIGATAVTDLWAVIRKRLFGVAPPDFGLVGRWLAHMARGRFRHDSIAAAARVRGERPIGWIAHYLIGISFAAVLVGICGHRMDGTAEPRPRSWSWESARSLRRTS